MGYTNEQYANRKLQRQEEALRRIVKEATPLSGMPYFEKVIQLLQDIFQARHVFIGLVNEEQSEVKTLVYASQNGIESNFRYSLLGSPCHNVMETGACSYTKKASDLFPDDPLLQQMGIEAYVGAPILSRHSKPIGVITALFTSEIGEDEAQFISYIFELLSHSFANEFERIEQERKLKASEANFRAITENTQDLVFSVNRSFEFLTINSRCKAFVRKFYNVELSKGMHLFQALRIKDQRKYLSRFERCFNGERFTTIDRFQLQGSGEEETYYEVAYNPIWSSGSVAGASVTAKNITYRILAQKKLQESDARNRSIISSLSEGIVLHDTDGKIVLHNKAACQILKLTEEQLLGTSPLDSQWECIKENGEKLSGEDHPASVTLSTGEACQNVIMGAKTPTTELSWILVNSVPIFDQFKQEIQGVAVSFSDITAIKNAARRVSESERRYRLLANHSADIISRHLGDGTCLYASPAIYRLLGVNEDEVLGNQFWAYVHPDDKETLEGSFRAILEGQGQRRITYRFVRKTGEHTWVESVGSQAESQEDGKEIVLLTRDISEIKAAEIALTASEQEKSNILAALDNAALVSITDLEGKIKHINQKVCEISGYTKEELIGQPHNIIGSGHHNDDFWKEMWQTIEQGECWRGEVKNKTKNGDFYWVDTVITPIKSQEGDIYEYMAVRYLITDKKELYEHKEELIKDLEEYAFITSHQLRGPLARLLGLSNLITNDHIRTGEFQSVVRMIKNTSEELDQITREMNQVLGRTLYSDHEDGE